MKLGLEGIFAAMFGVIFFYQLLSQGFASQMPTASAVTIWSLNWAWVIGLVILAVVMFSGYGLIKKSMGTWH